MNATPAWPAYRRLRTRLRDGISDARRREGASVERTWSLRPGWPAMLRIDHILTAGVRLEDAVVHRVDGSDHRAVAATIRPVVP
jgi:endonuclease/exonuclease/phosphatase family metal-dependent hydrolase